MWRLMENSYMQAPSQVNRRGSDASEGSYFPANFLKFVQVVRLRTNPRETGREDWKVPGRFGTAGRLLSGAEMNRAGTLYNDRICHWWHKPSPLNLLAAYSSTDEPRSRNCQHSAEWQKHTNTHTHARALRNTSHTQSCLQSPKASNNKKKKKIRRASCRPPALKTRAWQKNRGHAHAQTRTCTHRVLLLIHASVQNACRCQNTLLGHFFAWQRSRERALIHVPRQEGIFREELLARAGFTIVSKWCEMGSKLR